MATSTVNLQKAFQAVTTTLKENQAGLNQADTYNHNHGDNVVDTFEVITQAVKEKKGSSPSAQLAHASRLLADKPSGSAKIYSQNLAQAAQTFRGKKVTQDNALDLVTTLLGASGQASSTGGGNPLAGLLGGLMGGGSQQTQASGQQDDLAGLLGGLMGGGSPQPQSPGQQDPLAGLLGGLMGGGQSTPQAPTGNDGLGLDDLLSAGMNFMQAKQQGQSTTQALINAVLSASPMAGNAPREQSGSLIASTLMQVLGGLGKK
jgi:hypothetical protein